MKYLLSNVIITTLLCLLACGETAGSGGRGSMPASQTASYCTSLPEGVQALPTSHYELYRNYSSFQGEQFLQYVHAVSYVESRFNPRVRSSRAAYGLMQITRIAMLEAAAFCHIPPVHSMDRLYDPQTNIRYGTCYLKFLLEQTDETDWTRTLIVYNGGYRQLELYENGMSIAPETANYVLKVKHVVDACPPLDIGKQ